MLPEGSTRVLRRGDTPASGGALVHPSGRLYAEAAGTLPPRESLTKSTGFALRRLSRTAPFQRGPRAQDPEDNMQYEVESKQLTTIRRRLEFSVPGSAVKAELKMEYDKLRRTVRLRGFRPGKVPVAVIKKRFGGQVRADVAERMVNQVWREAVSSVEVAGQPQLVDQGDLSSGQTFSFAIEVDVRPDDARKVPRRPTERRRWSEAPH